MRRVLFWVLSLLLLLTLCAGAYAAEIRPVDIEQFDVDLTNGAFCLWIRDADQIADGGWFTAGLYMEDNYDAQQIESMVPGDTVLVNGQTWTVREVEYHPADEFITTGSYEIYTEEENDGYILFARADDGYYYCRINDWVPVSPVGDVRIMLPLPDKFEYYNDVLDEPLDMDGLLDELEDLGGYFVPYNTWCVMEEGMLVRITHHDYPEGPEVAEDEDVEAEEPAADSADSEDTAAAVPVWKFCHGLRDGLETAVITGYTTDCEEGPSEYAMTQQEIDDIRDLAINGVITGKANDLSVTGGTWVYSFTDPEGKHLLSIEMYQGLIVDPASGMYRFTR